MPGCAVWATPTWDERGVNARLPYILSIYDLISCNAADQAATVSWPTGSGCAGPSHNAPIGRRKVVKVVSDAANSSATEADPSILAWVKDAVGDRLLAYLLACDVSALDALISGDTTPTNEQLDAITSFANLRDTIPAGMKNDDITAHAMIVRFLAQAAPGRPSVATSMRQRIVGGEIFLNGEDDMERALIAACSRYVSSLLAPHSFRTSARDSKLWSKYRDVALPAPSIKGLR